VAFIGGSLLPFGGQNLIEAMRMGKPILIGEHTFNFKYVSELAVAQGAAWRVKDLQMLTQAIQALLANPKKRGEMGASGLALCHTSQGATQATLDLISTIMVHYCFGPKKY
jgi:3-deoxy-D-manno-octulosonic-acid transferase